MPRQLTPLELQRIHIYLGVPVTNIDYTMDSSIRYGYDVALSLIFTDDQIAYITSMLTQLHNVDVQLANAFISGAVMATDTTKLNFLNQRNMLLVGGTMLVDELATFLGVAVTKHKYKLYRSNISY